MPSFRPFHSADHAEIVDVARALPEWFTAEGVRNLILDILHQKGFAAHSEQQKIIGFVTYFVNQGVAQIGWMGVHPSQHRRRIGEQLLLELEKHLKACGISKLQVSTLGDAVDYEPYARTRAFYRKNGFTDLQVIKHPENPSYEEELLLQKTLL